MTATGLILNSIPWEPDRPAIRSETILGGVKHLQGIVGGYLEVVPLRARDLPSPATLYVNEDGWTLGLNPNPLASALALMPIVGPAVLIGTPDSQGWDTDLPDRQDWTAFLTRMIREANYFLMWNVN